MKTKNTETCRLCGRRTKFIFSGQLIGRKVDYFDCSHCGYLQTETPIWLDEAYASPINESDTGIIERNILNTRRIGAVSMLLGKKTATIVDFAGGYGLLVRMLRDAGLPAYWSDKYCDNLFARGFEHQGETADIATAIEVFEHFTEPADELKRMLLTAPTIFMSTLLLPEPVPDPADWWYYGEEHGQHIGFYRKQTLEFMAAQNDANLYTNDLDLHIIMRKPGSINIKYLGWMMRFWPIVRRYRLSSLISEDHAEINRKIALGRNSGS